MHPLGLIGSGSLLICCEEEFCGTLAESIREAGIGVNGIGEVLGSGVAVEACDHQQRKPVEWPPFELDEITLLLNRQSGQGDGDQCNCDQPK